LIRFQVDADHFKIRQRLHLKNWLKKCIISHDFVVGDICFVFVTDDALLEINKQYLNHDYYTDVITFDYSENKVISGDILISVDMILFNATKFSVNAEQELFRVMAHGVLHLMGFKDKSKKDAAVMRKMEQHFLEQKFSVF
jgi:probable rRNA maturation factor